MKEVTLQVPDGKRVEWREVNGVTIPVLVDEQVKDDRPVTERIKTFEDAFNALEETHLLRKEWNVFSECIRNNAGIGKDIVAILKLRIIAAALNEGWEPRFTTDEYRWFPWFVLYTEKEIDEMDEEEKARVVARSCVDANAYCGVACVHADGDSSDTGASFGSRLAFKTRELAEYAGKTFIEIWADWCFAGALEFTK